MTTSKTPDQLVAAIRRKAVGKMTNPENPIGVMAGKWAYSAKAGVKQAQGSPLEVVCYASTAAVDLEREVVLPSGCDMQTYLGVNRNLFVDHNYDVCSAVAVVRTMSMAPSGWLCHGVFHDDMTNPYVRACIALAKAGTLAMSIGFEALEWGPPTKDEAAAYPGVESVVRRCKVLEVSYTAMPMNVTCRMVGAGVAAASENAEKSRKALIEAKVADRIISDFGVRPKRVIVVR
jgi:hypothetical protein